MSPQLPLALRWPASQRFESFVAGPNALAVAALLELAGEPEGQCLFLAGAAGVGKTHLLMAACAQASLAGHSAQYIDLARLGNEAAAAIRGLGGSDLLALDNVGAIAGQAAAEHALFDLYNRLRAEHTSVLFAAHDVPTSLGLGLPDLVSRLSACTQWALRALDEADRRRALRERAEARGIELDEAVLDWLFTRQARDLGTLTALLDRIDHAALAAQRRVTIPFLRALLETSGTAGT